jgi:hypothetical protein
VLFVLASWTQSASIESRWPASEPFPEMPPSAATAMPSSLTADLDASDTN